MDDFDSHEFNMSQLASFREAIKNARCPVALAGAGLSAASGIPTFRGAGGLWRQNDAMSLATPSAFQSDTSKVWQFYHYRREVCLNTKPNAAHNTLALLSTKKYGAKIFPNAQKGFHFVTQNVDGLSVRAAEEIKHLQPVEPIQICTICRDERNNFDSSIAPALHEMENLSKEYSHIDLKELPRCSKEHCRGLLRPAVVWFGECIPLMPKIERLLDQCDLLLVLGTSSTVYPAAGFAAQVQAQGGKTAVFK